MFHLILFQKENQTLLRTRFLGEKIINIIEKSKSNLPKFFRLKYAVGIISSAPHVGENDVKIHFW